MLRPDPYNSEHTGAQIDEAVSRALPDGEFDIKFSGIDQQLEDIGTKITGLDQAETETAQGLSDLIASRGQADGLATLGADGKLSSAQVPVQQIMAVANAAEYSASETYALGAYCTKDGKLYRCSTAIEEAEAWTAGHWTETSVSAELTSLARQLSESGGVKLIKLWENASPKSAFAAQTVSLDLSAYHYVVIEDSNLTSDSPLIVYSRIYKVGERSAFIGIFGVASTYRFLQINENGITFGAGYRPNQDDNTRNVPYRIYGIVGLTIT